MLISIITVVYNNQEGIGKTIESVINQTYNRIEYIIIDGGSTDGTLSVIENYRKHISSVLSERDGGIYDAMNKGIKIAKGELIGIINSGDFYEPDAVQNIVNTYVSSPSTDVFHGILRIFSESGKILSVRGSHSNVLSYEMIQHPTCFVKRSVYDKFGYYSLEYKSSSDYEFMLRIWKNNVEFYFLEMILANYYTGGMSYQPMAFLETVRIRHRYALISTGRRILNEAIYYLKGVFG